MKRGQHQLLIGDVRKTLPKVKRGSVQTAITSPPFWGLRSYLKPDDPMKGFEIGMEPTPELYIQHIVEVMREVRETLHPTGTLFLNLGDTYATGAGKANEPGGGEQGERWKGNRGTHTTANSGKRHGPALQEMGPTTQPNRMPIPGLKSGDMCNIPHRVAEALRADGWFWRDTIIWNKRAPMPSSVSGWRWMRCRVKVATGKFNNDRNIPGRNGTNDGHRDCGSFATDENKSKWSPCPGCDKCRATDGYVLRKGRWRTTTASEYVFMFSKSEIYFCDGDAVQEAAIGKAPGNVNPSKAKVAHYLGDEMQRTKAGLGDVGARETRNPRNVWTLSGEGYKGAHFAVWPSELVKRILLAATSAGGCCLHCLTPWAPIVESERMATRPGNDTKVYAEPPVHPDSPLRTHNGTVCGNRDPKRHIAVTRILGYRQSCWCESAEPIPQTVLDPFAGSGTTLQVSTWYGRDAIGCELNEDYARLVEARVETMPRCMMRERNKKQLPAKEKPAVDEGLFAGLK